MADFDSKYGIGDRVQMIAHVEEETGEVTRFLGTVEGVSFTQSKVRYDILVDGWETALRNVDSDLVEPPPFASMFEPKSGHVADLEAERPDLY